MNARCRSKGLVAVRRGRKTAVETFGAGANDFEVAAQVVRIQGGDSEATLASPVVAFGAEDALDAGLGRDLVDLAPAPEAVRSLAQDRVDRVWVGDGEDDARSESKAEGRPVAARPPFDREVQPTGAELQGVAGDREGPRPRQIGYPPRVGLLATWEPTTWRVLPRRVPWRRVYLLGFAPCRDASWARGPRAGRWFDLMVMVHRVCGASAEIRVECAVHGARCSWRANHSAVGRSDESTRAAGSSSAASSRPCRHARRRVTPARARQRRAMGVRTTGSDARRRQESPASRSTRVRSSSSSALSRV
jgi:hypothetical protein